MTRCCARRGTQPGLAAADAWAPRGGVRADIRDSDRLGEIARGCDAVFHLAAQVAVTTSLSAPMEDFDINLRATVALLRACVQRGRAFR